MSLSRLSLELFTEVVQYLDSASLAFFCLSCKAARDVCIPILYRNLDIKVLNTGAPSSHTLILFRTLLHKPAVCRFIRNVQFSSMPSYWTRGHASFIHFVLSMVLHDSTTIKSFCWAAEYSPTNIIFSGLTSLRYSIHRPEDSDWVQLHLRCFGSKLNNLYLSSSYLSHVNYCNDFFRQVSLGKTLKTLRLRSINITSLKLLNTKGLEELELSFCNGTQECLRKITMSNNTISLKILRLTTNASVDVSSFLDFIYPSSRLEELVIRQTSQKNLDLKSILRYGPTLRVIVVDMRRNIFHPASCHKYSANDVKLVLENAPVLQYLGLPVDLEGIWSVYSKVSLI